MVEVKRATLVNELMKLRQSFMSWDDERRKKVDIVLSALDNEETYVNIEEAIAQVHVIASKHEKYHELQDSALKVLDLEFAKLSLSGEEKRKDDARYTKAHQKLREFEKRGML